MALSRKLFVDTSYAVALSSVSDQHNQQARLLAQQIRQYKSTFITTRAVLFEIGNSLSRLRFRKEGATLLTTFESDVNVEIVNVVSELYNRALQLFVKRPDKEWSLTDCLSFVVMQERGLTDALTSDEHFEQAGFRALLRTT